MCEHSHWYNPFFLEKYCKRMGALAAIPFFYGECVNLKSLQRRLQQQLQYSLSIISLLRKAIVVICTCKSGFWNN